MPTPAAPRVLYLTHRVPFPPDKGDRIRNFHLLRQLARRARVWLAALADEPPPAESLAALAGLCEKVSFVPVLGWQRPLRAGASAVFGGSLTAGAFAEPVLHGLVRRWAADAGFSAALVSTSGLAPYLKAPALRGVPKFVDLVDVDSQKWLDYAAASRGPKRLLYQFEGRRLRALEAGLPRWTQGVSIVSRAEADVYESFAGPGTATVAMNGVDLEVFAAVDPDAPTEPALAFVGAMDYRPNVDAVTWFAAEVWPRVLAENPGAEFRVIGRKPTAAVLKLASVPGVRVLGTVPDVRPLVAKAAVVVAPMRLSRGLQNKVLEAMAMGKAVIASPPALAALAVEPGVHLLQATTPGEWAAAIHALLTNPVRRAELGRAARGFVEGHHHWDRCLAPLLDAVCPVPAGVAS